MKDHIAQLRAPDYRPSSARRSHPRPGSSFERWRGIPAFAALLLVQIGCASTPTRESSGQYIDDSVITSKAKAKISADELLQSLDIHVNTFKGVIQLSGFVDSKEAAERAGKIAAGVAGVRRVVNDLLVKPRAAAGAP